MVNPVRPASELSISARLPGRVPLVAQADSTRFRQRIHGVALMVVGGVALSSGVLVLDPALALIVGAGMAAYGVYLCLR